MLNNYTVLHCHSDMSNGITNIDSCTKYQDYIEKAAELGMKALAISEHGSVMSWVHKKQDMEKAGLKYIHAEEFYITETLKEKVRDNFHCLLIAKNYEGVLELNKLSTKSFNREDNSFYYVPRITLDDLINTSDNIIVSTACLGGILSKGSKEVKAKFFKFILTNKNRCFLELQPHLDPVQIKYNQILYDLHKKYEIEMVMCTDTHALNASHVEARKILQKAKKIHFDGEDNFHLEFLSYDDLVSLCEQQGAVPMESYLEAIENTNKIADMVVPFDLDYSYKYPHLWGDNSEKIFMQKIKDGIKWRGVDKFSNRQEYIDRVNYELEAYRHNGAIDFMLLMEDIISWCKTVDIQVGYGRGSVNGSVVAWLLGITEMDSIKHKLNFDRFMNVERVSLSDIDTDFPPSRIDEVKQYIFNRHGLYCSDIITFNTVALKGAIRDVGRALELPLSTVGEICDTVELKEEELRREFPDLFKYVDMVNGTIVSIGNHPCGMIVAPYSIDDKLGLLTTTTDTVAISQINMKEIDSLNYVKLDLLKLDTIEIINETCKLANIDRLTPDNVDITRKEVWDSIRDNTTGIFQWEGSTGDRYIKHLLSDQNIESFKKINPDVDYMTLLSIGNSAIRPAGASYRDDLASGVVRKTGSKALDDFLKPTFGYLVFQCQIIEFLHEYCGFTMGQADIVRRHFAKKYGTDKDIPIIKNGGYMDDKKENYIKGFIQTMKEKYNMSKEEAEKTIVYFLQVIEDASNYLFSLNHSQPYSYEGYVCGFLRYYYPLQFLTVCLNINKDNEEKTKAVTQYANSHGIEIKPPVFRHSKSDYMFDEKLNSIYKGLSSVKFLSADVADALYEMRNIEYMSFVDFLKEFPGNTKQREILIYLGFFREFGEAKRLSRICKLYDTYYGKKNIKKEKNILPEEIMSKYATKETDKMYKFENGIGLDLLRELEQNIPNTDISLKEKMAAQKKYLGYIDITDNSVNGNIYFVNALLYYKGDKNTCPRVEVYRIKDGATKILKLRSFNNFKDHPFEEGSIIEIPVIEENFKKKKDENGKRVITNEIVESMSNWRIISN